jgi:hypothetical protein
LSFHLAFNAFSIEIQSLFQPHLLSGASLPLDFGVLIYIVNLFLEKKSMSVHEKMQTDYIWLREHSSADSLVKNR